MDQPGQQEVVGFYHMMERHPLAGNLPLEAIQLLDKGIMLQFMGRVAGVEMLALDPLLVAEVFDHISIKKPEQPFQLIDPLAGLAGPQQLIKV